MGAERWQGLGGKANLSRHLQMASVIVGCSSQTLSAGSMLFRDQPPREKTLTGWGQRSRGENGTAVAVLPLNEGRLGNLFSTSAVWLLFLLQRTGGSSSLQKLLWLGDGESPCVCSELKFHPPPTNFGDWTGFRHICHQEREIQVPDGSPSKVPQVS